MCKKYRFITFLVIEILLFIKQCPLKFVSGNKWRSTKVGAKLLSDLVIFSIRSSDIPLDFHNSIWVVPLKYLVGINTKFWNIPKEKYFAPLRIQILFIKSFVNCFFDIVLTFFDSSFNSFLFDEISFSLLSKNIFLPN